MNTLAAPLAAPVTRDGRRILFSLGNLSVARMFEVWGSPVLEKLPMRPTPDSHVAEREAAVEQALRLGADAIEDYIGWGVVEQSPGTWDFSAYIENARAARSRGLGYILFSWVHLVPSWARNDPRYPRTTCLEHGLINELPSVFADETVEIFDRYYAQLAASLGDSVDLLRFAAPVDYGEVAYPAGAANWAFPLSHVHEGFWCGEEGARTHFRNAIEREFEGDLDAVNRVWNTSYRSFDEIAYPDEAASDRHRVDFLSWYQNALTERIGLLLGTMRTHFPNTPMLMSIGWPWEKAVLGHDITGLVREAARRGFEVRTPVGPMVGFLYFKRIATAVRHGKPAGLSSEPVDGNAPVESIALSLFKDLTGGMAWHFDYGDNYERAPAPYAKARELWRSGEYPIVETALFFDTTHHRLLPKGREKVMGDADSGYPAYPDGLLSFAESLRQVTDFDVLDEALAADGALGSYRLLLWPIGSVVRQRTATAVLDWVRSGGVLVISGADDVRVLEDGSHPFAALPANDGAAPLGAGFIVRVPADGIDSQDWHVDLAACAASFTPDANPAFARWIEATRTALAADNPQAPIQQASLLLQPLVAERGVLVSRFRDGLLLHNATANDVTVTLGSSGRSVALEAYALHWQPA